MAIKDGIGDITPRGYFIHRWDGLGRDDEGRYIETGPFGIKTVQIVAAPAGGDSAAIQGSMDGTNWFDLHALEFETGEYLLLNAVSVSMMVTVIENPRFMRPKISNVGGGTANFSVHIGAATRV